MLYLMIILRILHIFAGVFWVGASFVNMGFLQPTVQATGAEGQKVMGHLTRRTRFVSATLAAATITLFSGLIMYWILSGLRLGFLSSGYGLVLTVGAIAGLIAWVMAIFFVRRILNRMGALGQQIQAQGSPPSAEQASEMQALGAQLVSLGRVALVFLVIALLGMSVAQYAAF
jgi:uncharacterized membrane protein